MTGATTVGAAARRASRGRPPSLSSEERRRQLVAAAETMFLTKGFHATTVDDVARAAGMSKKSVYLVFASKSEMFQALLTAPYQPLGTPPIESGRPLEEDLLALLGNLASTLLAPRQIAVIRLMIAEAPSSREMADALDRSGLGRGKGALEQWVIVQADRGLLRIEDPVTQTTTLLFAAIGDLLLTSLLKADEYASAAAIQARVAASVRIFLKEFAVARHLPSSNHSLTKAES